MTTIGNCWWCGTPAEVWGSPKGRHGVCPACYARGPASAGEPEAIAAWNRLAGPDVVIGRLRWVPAGKTLNLFMGDQKAGDIMRWHAGGFIFTVEPWVPNPGGLGPFETEQAARAALVEAVKAAMGGGE